MFGLYIVSELYVSRLHAPYFSMEVAREVTQPLWPSRVPLRMSCSVMMAIDCGLG